MECHPLDEYIRPGRIPHIWCPGCGLGIVMVCFINAMKDSCISPDKIAVVSGIGCTGRIAGYLNVDSYHTTHGRAIPFATGLKMAKPDLNVVVISGDGDLFAIGGNHFIHAARRNVHLSIICVNNLNYGMTGGQKAPTTPMQARTSTSPAGNDEPSFNLPFLAKAAGSVYVARWTTLHVRRVKHSMEEALAKKGFSFLEILSPCPTVYGSMNKLGSALDELKYFRDNSITLDGADPGIADVQLRGRLVVGKFVDIEKPVYEPWKSRLEAAKGAPPKAAVTA